ncbi:MAG: substrate-binding domain-containing protein [Alphaproteobacteria bacterium]|nr:substrate-binding domain-containing protein [Alphaproteobacteria bacterium]
MRAQQATVYRGLYGPPPAALIASALLWRHRLTAWGAALLSRFSSGSRALQAERPAAVGSLQSAGRQLAFRPVVPAQVLRGYRLGAAATVPGCSDLLTLIYQAEWGRRFSISQRPGWLPLADELRLARVPATPVRLGSLHMFVVHGVYIDEPIDHAYSARSRRSVAIQLGDLVVELREVTSEGPGLRGLLAMARSMAEQVGRAERFAVDAAPPVLADPVPATSTVRVKEEFRMAKRRSEKDRGRASLADRTGVDQPTRRGFLRRGSAALAAALGTVGVRGSGARAQPPGGPRKAFRVAMVLPSFDQRRWKAADGAFFLKRARELGMDPLPLQASNNDPVLQASQVENLLNQNIDGLVLVAVDVDAAVASVQKANAAGVAVVAHNYIVPNVKLCGVSARDGVELGRYLGRAITDRAPKGNYVITKGEEGTDIARLKAQGGMEIIAPLVKHGAIKIVSDQWMRAWSGDLARKQVEQALIATNNDLAAVVSYADSMSYGVIEAVRAQGLTGKVLITGEDAEPEMLRLILKGDAFVSAWTKFDEMGVRSAELLYECLSKQPTTAPARVNNGAGEVPWFKIGIMNVTKDGKSPNSITVAEFADQNPWWVTKQELGL